MKQCERQKTGDDGDGGEKNVKPDFYRQKFAWFSRKEKEAKLRIIIYSKVGQIVHFSLIVLSARGQE